MSKTPDEAAGDRDSNEIEAIFDEVRRLYGVAYVSAIHHSLSTQPGFLEWAWAEVAPAFRTGAAQEAGWLAARQVQAPALDPIAMPALAAWGLERRDVASVRAAAETFLRVAPVNMMFAALIKLRLEDAASARTRVAREETWQPPAAIEGTAPEMVDPDQAAAGVREVAMLFATDRDGDPFVPGLYRMLLNWPGLAAHFATVLPPRLQSAAATTACDALRARIDAAAPEILGPSGGGDARRAAPSMEAKAYFARISETYRKTSPELVVASRLILEALPGS